MGDRTIKRVHYIANTCVLLGAFVWMGCSQDIGLNTSFNVETTHLASKPAPRLDVCHLDDDIFKKININGNARKGHLKHGDVLPGTNGLDQDCNRVSPDDPGSGGSGGIGL